MAPRFFVVFLVLPGHEKVQKKPFPFTKATNFHVIYPPAAQETYQVRNRNLFVKS